MLLFPRNVFRAGKHSARKVMCLPAYIFVRWFRKDVLCTSFFCQQNYHCHATSARTVQLETYLSGKPERKAQSSFEYLSAVAICYFSFAKCDISVCTKIVFCGKVMSPRTQFMMVNCISRNLQYSVIFALNSSRSIAFSLSYPVSWTDNSQRVRSQRPWFL